MRCYKLNKPDVSLYFTLRKNMNATYGYEVFISNKPYGECDQSIDPSVFLNLEPQQVAVLKTLLVNYNRYVTFEDMAREYDSGFYDDLDEEIKKESQKLRRAALYKIKDSINKRWNLSLNTNDIFLGMKEFRKINVISVDINGDPIEDENESKVDYNINSSLSNYTIESQNHFTRIDSDFIDGCMVSDSEEAKMLFHNHKQSSASIFDVVVNDLIIHDYEIDNVLDKLYKMLFRSPAVFLLSNAGGIGKSTLMCRIALKAYSDGYTVYYLDSDMRCPLPDFEEKTIILIDDAGKHSDTVESLYKHLKNNRNVHVVMADRVYMMKTLFDNVDIPRWSISGKAIFLSRDNEYPVTTLSQRNIIIANLSNEHIKRVTDDAIRYIKKDNELHDDVSIRLTYDNKSYTDVAFDFCVGYNKIMNEKTAKFKPFKWDWDVWNELRGLEDSFKYVAALNVVGVRVSSLCFEYMTGHSEALYKAVKEGVLPRVQITSDGYIRLGHDTVADNYFKVTGSPPQNVLYVLLKNHMLDEKTIVSFEKVVFSVSNIKNPSGEMSKYDIPELLKLFYSDDYYRRIMIKNGRFHSLEFASIMQGSLTVKDKKAYFSKKIGESFEKADKAYSASNNKVFMLCWIKYFFFNCKVNERLPIQMLSSLSARSNMYKRLTEVLERHIKSSQYWLTEIEKKRLFSNAEDFFLWIIEKIDEKDIPSRMLLKDIYGYRNDYEKQRTMIDEVAELRCNTNTPEHAVNYIETYSNEVKYLLSKDRNDPKINSINSFIRNYYNDYIREWPAYNRYTDDYVMLVGNYARHLIETGWYDTAYKLMTDVVDEFEKGAADVSLFRIYIELGLLYQRKRSRNQFYDLECSSFWFRKALEYNTSKKDSMYVKKPLCKNLLMDGKYSECIDVCMSIRQIDSKDRETTVLLLEATRLKFINELCLPVGSFFTEVYYGYFPDQELRQKCEEMLSMMTEEQRATADAWGLVTQDSKVQNSLTRCKVLYSILYNVPIQLKVLKHLSADKEKTSNALRMYNSQLSTSEQKDGKV